MSERAKRDPLEGVRGIGGNLIRHRVSVALSDIDSSDLRHEFITGLAAGRIVDKTAEIADYKTVVAEVLATCETRVRDNMLILLGEADPTSKAARDAHYEARVAGGILSMFNDLIQVGIEAARKIDNEGERDE